MHSASGGKFALVTVHPKRGKEGMDAADVLPAFAGIACHGAWKPLRAASATRQQVITCPKAGRLNLSSRAAATAWDLRAGLV